MLQQFSVRFAVCVVLLAFLLTSCQLTATPLPPGQRLAVSLLVHLDGSAQIKREGWKDYQPVGFGTLVYPTDLLKTDGSVTLLCADLQTVKSSNGEARNPCPLPGNGFVLTYDDMRFSPGQRSVSISAIPTLISPRSTTILHAHPLLRWNDTGAASYTVEIRQSSQLVWTAKDVTSTEIAYPVDVPALDAGKDYLLIVTDNTTGHTSSEDKEKGLGFQMVSEAQRAEIEARRQSIFGLTELDEPSKKLALALYYIHLRIGGRGLWSDARLLLEEVAQAKPNEPALSLRLADVLASMKLWDEANAAYATARAQAENTGDLETQADALAGIWRIEPSQVQDGETAVSYYEQIGASDKAGDLKEEMKP